MFSVKNFMQRNHPYLLGQMQQGFNALEEFESKPHEYDLKKINLQLRRAYGNTLGGIQVMRSPLKKEANYFHSDIDKDCHLLIQNGILRFKNISNNLLLARAVKSIQSIIEKEGANEKERIIKKISQDLEINSLIMSTMLNKSILNLAKYYLGTHIPCIHKLVYLYSNPMDYSKMSDEDKSNSAFLYHRDIPGSRSLKIFLNLSSLGKSGNHFFIQKSHSLNALHDNKKITIS